MEIKLIPGLVALGLTAFSPVIAQESPPAAGEAAAPEQPAAETDPAVIKTNSSYGFGYRTGSEFSRQYGAFGITTEDLETEAFTKGFLDAFKGAEPQIAEEKLGAAMQALGARLEKREQDLAAGNLKAGQDFLSENATKEGVTTLASGLQYIVLKEGEGAAYAAPKEGEAPKQFLVNYEGSLIDGTVFDSSPQGQPVPMTLQVIDGFKEALQLMKTGAKWRLFIPSDLAYGDQRRSAEIGPNSVLIFDLELVSIEDQPQAHGGGLPFPKPHGE